MKAWPVIPGWDCWIDHKENGAVNLFVNSALDPSTPSPSQPRREGSRDVLAL